MFSRGGIFQTETEEWVFSRLRHRWLETGIPGKENRMFKGQEIKKTKFSMIRDMIRPKARGGNISCKEGLDKGQKLYEPNRSRRY